jgi:GT2 family glycosyltransferase
MIPKISVIVPNYIDVSKLSECIRSLLVLNYPKEKL